MTIIHQLDKNIPSKELDSSPESRALRLRRLRNLANLTRKEMCERSGIKPDTLIGWEVARHGGLTENGAKKIISCIANEGVVCALEWLIHAAGPGPTVLTDLDKTRANQTELPDPANDEDKLIIDGLLHLKTQYNDIIEAIVEDDAMAPQYQPGDHVAGVKRYHDRIYKLIGYDCIVQMTDGRCLLRCLREGSTKNRYTLLCSNPKSTTTPVIYDVEIISAAPIIWIRRKNPEI
jgi:transcriptional regulator with XRE-family HTH domain